MPEGEITRPNFIIIGAGRSGTTSLYHYLEQHPQIFMSPVKETNYFSYDKSSRGAAGSGPQRADDLFRVKSAGEYSALFASARSFRAAGEASPLYLYAPGTAERIKKALPDARIVAILRNPVDRAYSNYRGYVRDAVEKRSFTEAVREERAGTARSLLRGSHNYLRAGYYARNLKPYFDLFDRNRIAIFLFEDFVENPVAVTRQLFQFLEVDSEFSPDTSIRYNATGFPKSRRLHHLLSDSAGAGWIKSRVTGSLKSALMKCAVFLQRRNLKKGDLSPTLRSELTDLFREDIVALQSMIDRDLTDWLVSGERGG